MKGPNMEDTLLGIYKITQQESERRANVVEEAIASVKSDDKDGPTESVMRIYREYINGNIKSLADAGKLIKEASTRDAIGVISYLHHQA